MKNLIKARKDKKGERSMMIARKDKKEKKDMMKV